MKPTPAALLLFAGIAASACNAPDAATPSARAAADRPISVLTEAVSRRDVPVDLEGIGNVIANKTVTVRAQVDGRLDAVLFEEGQAVKRGQVLAQLDPRPFKIQLAQAQGSLARDQSLLTDGQLNLTRYEKLTDKKFIAPQQLDDQRALIGQYQGAVQVDRAAIDSAHLNLSYARITSPIDGVTGVRLVDQGNIVRASDPGGIVVVTQLDPIAVVFTLPQDDLPEIARRMRAGTLGVDAYDRAGVRKLASGELLVIDNQINQATASIRLKASFPNAEHTLWPNQFVKVRLHVSTEKDVLVIPTSSVQRGPKGTFAYVTNAAGVVNARPIEVALSLSDQTIVKSGLSEGEQVVVEGQNQLREGARVVIRRAGKAAPVAEATTDAGATP